ncbi:pigment-dispersing hormone peptides-like [Neocloeon triangulifer]|uniref:pigment-dispersing hormone peptides-like n=1 Tax=Neocloeon triangulifer TaxID=2078957 RepID=UPI00286EED76|nr:pigment-dispersing hormone peptides-like [Neocloeon triangulifer]
MNHLVASALLVVALCVVEGRSEGVGVFGAESGGAEQEAATGNSQQNFINHFSRVSSVSCKHHYRELANYLLDLAKEALARSAKPMCERKRNSELINSLLGLPKVMNDAGRK